MFFILECFLFRDQSLTKINSNKSPQLPDQFQTHAKSYFYLLVLLFFDIEKFKFAISLIYLKNLGAIHRRCSSSWFEMMAEDNYGFASFGTRY